MTLSLIVYNERRVNTGEIKAYLPETFGFRKLQSVEISGERVSGKKLYYSTCRDCIPKSNLRLHLQEGGCLAPFTAGLHNAKSAYGNAQSY
ncbi:hypothetical protein VSU01S_20550 [Vibrio superstes NBRC 103154]|uniref:Uncharacterized protein n=1 Tax=Vibrio superstes NBRC 103154 TaxID=1219062 RepID=A0A511QR56_9VIBR|nr:hypothetical protein VSU01S_20550 [Vibrio superstes NBRC 103154]